MIELQQARELLKHAVETQGRDFVYNPGGIGRCYYSPKQINLYETIDKESPKWKTGCLIGVALSLAGIAIRLDERGSINSIYYRNRAMMTIQAMQYFNVAQVAQDNGSSWGKAYD